MYRHFTCQAGEEPIDYVCKGESSSKKKLLEKKVWKVKLNVLPVRALQYQWSYLVTAQRLLFVAYHICLN